MNQAKADIIGNIVETELGVSLAAIRGRGRKPHECTARTVFVALNELAGDFNSATAAKYLNRSVEEINHIRRQHAAWNKTNLEYAKAFDAARTVYKAHLPELNDIELAEVRAELEYNLSRLQLKLARVVAEQLIRNQNQNSK